jgi:hypothetical protein
MPKHKIHLQKNVWVLQISTNPECAMRKCLHGLHDAITQMEWNGCHSSGSQLIFQVGKNGSNKDNCSNF